MSRQDSQCARDRRQPVALQDKAQRLSVHVGETAQHHHHPHYIEIVLRSRRRMSQGLPELECIVGDDLVVVGEVEVVLYPGRKPADPGP